MNEPPAPADEKPEIPSRFQRKTLWSAITALSIVAIGGVFVGLIALTGSVLSVLQPVLVPLAVAGIIAYLLEPIVDWISKRGGLSHNNAMMIVFVSFLVFIIVLVVSVVVPAFGQAGDVYENRAEIKRTVTDAVKDGISAIQNRFGTGIASEYYDRGVEWISEEGPKVSAKIGEFIWSRLSGFFGFFGYVLGLFLVPIYLFYFMREGHTISRSWTDYLPLRASRFKDEVVGSLTEINGYLISFFRGQMVVSLIDGALVAVALSVIGLPYALLIGVFLAILGLIPYVGNLLVMVPAVIIAIAHFGATTTVNINDGVDAEVGKPLMVLLEGEKKAEPKTVVEVSEDGKQAKVYKNAWNFLPVPWAYPIIVLAIFIILQQINGLVTAPKIVGDSVGLHPLTVIFSVIFWSVVLGGLLGALLAVPLTASIKVLFRRYIWEKRLEPVVEKRLKGKGGDDDPADSDEAGEPEPA
ncbi:MAG: AI-2E family transporter [Verrucomicrobiota bacterium]